MQSITSHICSKQSQTVDEIQERETFINRCLCSRMELYDTFKLFMQEQDIGNINDQPSFYLDYRPYTRQICQNEQHPMESQPNRRYLTRFVSF